MIDRTEYIFFSNGQRGGLATFLNDHMNNIIKIFSYNFLMLLFGLLGELNIIDKKIAVPIGFIFNRG